VAPKKLRAKRAFKPCRPSQRLLVTDQALPSPPGMQPGVVSTSCLPPGWQPFISASGPKAERCWTAGPIGVRRKDRPAPRPGNLSCRCRCMQREPDSDAPAPQPCRPIQPVGLPPRHRIGQALVLGRHRPFGAEAGRQQGLDHWSRDGHVRAGRRDRHGSFALD
jgi:hypothetical protein